MAIRDIFTAKTIRFIAITIVLGAIGSGAWEWVLKPALTSASEFGLDVATLGIKSFKDSLYQEVALGFHEEPSVRLYLAIFGILPSFILGVLSGGFFAVRNSKTENSEKNAVAHLMKWLYRPTLLIFTFMLVFSIVQANQMGYVSRAITHFHVLLQIAGPHLGEGQRLLYQSQFAQISSKDDYEKLVKELSALCREKNLKAPEFSVW